MEYILLDVSLCTSTICTCTSTHAWHVLLQNKLNYTYSFETLFYHLIYILHTSIDISMSLFLIAEKFSIISLFYKLFSNSFVI